MKVTIFIVTLSPFKMALLLKLLIFKFLVVSRPNGGQIFLPAAGDRWNGNLRSAGSRGYYWSSSLNPDYDDSAYLLYFLSSGWYRYNDSGRNYGQSVRAVRP